MLNPPKEVPIILKLCQHNWDKPNSVAYFDQIAAYGCI